MPDINVTPEAARLRMTLHPVTVLMKSNLWNVWSRVAIDHEATAWHHRAEWKAGQTRNVMSEFEASLVTAAAVAFTLDALHADVAPLIGRIADPQVRGKVWPYMRDTFDAACKPPGAWAGDFEWVFTELRKHAVHSRPEMHVPIWHDGLKSSVARENVLFSAESCTRAVDLMMEVFRALLVRSDYLDGRLADWPSTRGHVFAELEALRSKRAVSEPS
jgi:hypothetical protein